MRNEVDDLLIRKFPRWDEVQVITHARARPQATLGVTYRKDIADFMGLPSAPRRPEVTRQDILALARAVGARQEKAKPSEVTPRKRSFGTMTGSLGPRFRIL
jgi:hypothetical protein